MPDVLETKPADWKYVSEGGATIVYSYKGPSHPDFDGTVLRLRKAPVVVTFRADPVPTTTSEEETDDPTIEFQARCMARLIPSEHLPRLETVWLSRPWLEALVELQDHARPEPRRQKDQVDLIKGKGVLATDLVGGNWLAVEIKPKWGFLPSSTHLSEETKATKMQTCRFCLHSHFRAQKGHYQTITDYCPLDLFSGDENRLRQAIYSLWDAWIASDASANNLKIFAAGKYIRPSEVENIFAEGENRINDRNKIREIFAKALVQCLLKTKVLRILSDLQRNLDLLDIEGLSKLWKKAEFAALKQSDTTTDAITLTPLGGTSPHIQISDPEIADWTEFLDDFHISSRGEKNLKNHSEPSPKDLRYYIFAYLLSATFKDCSIIVRLDFLRSGDGLERPCTVVVIDLDPKSMSKLRSWEELDREIVTEYSPAHRKVCIDANQAKHL